MFNIILITEGFPYNNGEQFLETEVKYISKHKNINLTIMPKRIGNNKREVDNSIAVDNYLNDYNKVSKLTKIKYLGKVVFSKLFLKEMKSINFFNPVVFIKSLEAMLYYQKYYELFDEFLSTREDLENTVIYTYWHLEYSYALQSLKNKYNYKLVSRIHGQDLYKERRRFLYMPLKANFLNNIDKIYTITDTSNDYLVNNYGFDNSKLELSRLGVDDLNIVCRASEKYNFHVVSCSFLKDIKRVDKIIDSLYLLAMSNKDVKYKWTHIGGGLLYDELQKYARDKLDLLSNLEFDFLGNVPNKEIYKFYKINRVDIFLNTSTFEGVPVTIMEALSCHIPILAPNIGGISDMVQTGYNGVLLSSSSTVEEIVNALSDITQFKSEQIRRNAYRMYKMKYDAQKNYTNFITQIMHIVKYDFRS